MAIQRLSPGAVSRLGADLLVISPGTIIKELVDNAIDAKATAIEVIISANTLDKLLVRDNGCGIGAADFKLLGRRAHTSKLRDFEELMVKGGNTLGFRGDALASVNQVSRMTITTKTASDRAATELTLSTGRNVGGVSTQKPVSGSVGTAVEVAHLFKSQPVRYKEYLKLAPRTIKKIETMLQSYAMARPRLKLTYKIMGEGTARWSYAPSKSGDAREAVMQTYDVDLVSQCV